MYFHAALSQGVEDFLLLEFSVLLVVDVTDAKGFQDPKPANRDRLMAAIAHSIIDQEAGITTATFHQQTGSFDQWKQFLSDMGIHDECLEGYN